jgi:uncharacterized protein with NRDE domain
MCTLIVRYQPAAAYPTIIAANRDEFYARAWSPPQLLDTEPVIFGGRDEQQGGTWLGFTETGLFVGLTNQRNFAGYEPSRRSRGQLVLDALRTQSVHRLTEYFRELDASEYNDFNLMFGDGTELWVAYGRAASGSVEIERLSPGVHVLCNDRLDSPAYPKAQRMKQAVMAIGEAPWPQMRRRLASILADTSLPSASELPPVPPDSPFDLETTRRLQAICIRTPAYGTVSSTIAAIVPGRVEHYLFAPGPPDRTGFEDQSALLCRS